MDRYVLRKRLGGSREAYEARDTLLDRPVAVRFLEGPATAFPVDHPGVVPVYDAGRWRDGRPFIVTELVRGKSLDGLMHGLDKAQRLNIACHVAATVAALHAAGSVHGDVGAENILLSDDGRVLLLAGVANGTGPTEDAEALATLLEDLLGIRLPAPGGAAQIAAEVSRLRDAEDPTASIVADPTAALPAIERRPRPRTRWLAIAAVLLGLALLFVLVAYSGSPGGPVPISVADTSEPAAPTPTTTTRPSTTLPAAPPRGLAAFARWAAENPERLGSHERAILESLGEFLEDGETREATDLRARVIGWREDGTLDRDVADALVAALDETLAERPARGRGKGKNGAGDN